MNIFEKVTYAIRGIEASFVNLVATVAPWLAPLAPAFIAYHNVTTVLEFPWYLGLAIAAVIEGLGFSSMITIMDIRDHNHANAAEKNKINAVGTWFAFGFYLSVVVTMNVLLEIPVPRDQVTQLIARALLTLLSVPAIIVVAARKQKTEVEARIQSEKARRKRERTQRKAQESERKEAESLPESSGNFPVFRIRSRKEITPEMETFLTNGHSPEALQEIFPDVTGRTIRNWVKSFKET